MSFKIAVDAKTDGDEDVQQKDQWCDQGNRCGGHHEIQAVHVRVPIVAILRGGPVPEKQSSYRHEQAESHQGPEGSRPPGSPACMNGYIIHIINILDCIEMESISLFYSQITEERHYQVDGSVNSQSSESHIAQSHYSGRDEHSEMGIGGWLVDQPQAAYQQALFWIF